MISIVVFSKRHNFVKNVTIPVLCTMPVLCTSSEKFRENFKGFGSYCVDIISIV